MHVREGNPLSTFEAAGAQVQIFKPNQIVNGMYTWADQILCATNAKRMELNNYIRNQRGFNPNAPEIGDKIISLRNHWQTLSTSGSWALTNGAIGTITDFEVIKKHVPFYISQTPVEYMCTNMELEDQDTFIDLPIDYQCMITGAPALTPKQMYMMSKNELAPDPPFEFAYAYAITTHKAQGSEWDKVLVFEEGFPFNKEEHRRWLYTAVTRAKDKLVLISDM
jgi:exodeoxyribonuclease-5